jgi:hypothetical protein
MTAVSLFEKKKSGILLSACFGQQWGGHLQNGVSNIGKNSHNTK